MKELYFLLRERFVSETRRNPESVGDVLSVRRLRTLSPQGTY